MTYDHVLRVSRFAKKLRGTGPLSTGEALCAALVLNKPSWLKSMGYTMVEAIHRVDDDGQTIQHVLHAQRVLGAEG